MGVPYGEGVSPTPALPQAGEESTAPQSGAARLTPLSRVHHV